MHHPRFVYAGKELKKDGKVLIMIHGRGGSAEDILTLSQYLQVEDFTLVAPGATNGSWYPYSFMAPQEANEPWLSSALKMLEDLLAELEKQGVDKERIYLLGFSQGACLTLEFVARNAGLYGGVAAFTGGLIGQNLQAENYTGDFKGTPIFIGSSDPDPHVPKDRVLESETILRNLGAEVTVKIYPNMGHTIGQDEIDTANSHIFGRRN